MRLVLDVGNTRIKWAWAGGQAQALAHGGLDLCSLLREAWAGWPRPEAIHIASVASAAVNEALRQAIQACWPGMTAHFLVSCAECCGVRLAYTHPERFGVDRLAALVAARAEAEGHPLVVVDAGTAITVDALDASGSHLGGVIMPGLRLLKASLLGGTAGVAQSWAEEGQGTLLDQSCLQTSTERGVSVGAAWMVQGGVRQALEYACRQAGADARIYLTGGDAPLLRAAVRQAHHWRPDLVLDGVARMGREIAFAPARGMA